MKLLFMNIYAIYISRYYTIEIKTVMYIITGKISL